MEDINKIKKFAEMLADPKVTDDKCIKALRILKKSLTKKEG